MTASIVADQGFNARNIYTMEGDMLAWDEKPVEDVPMVRIFEKAKGLDDILMLAVKLEKEHRFFTKTSWRNILATVLLTPQNPISFLEKAYALVVARHISKCMENE